MSLKARTHLLVKNRRKGRSLTRLLSRVAIHAESPRCRAKFPPPMNLDKLVPLFDFIVDRKVLRLVQAMDTVTWLQLFVTQLCCGDAICRRNSSQPVRAEGWRKLMSQRLARADFELSIRNPETGPGNVAFNPHLDCRC